jgi:glycine/D-amino acid oxidase-like deaminating enzyme
MKKSGSSRGGRILSTDAVERLAAQLVPRYTQHPAGARVRRKLQALERNFRFTPRSRKMFQELLGRIGIASTQQVSLPISDEPFWLRAGHPLENYQSAPTLPKSVDVLIIGAGLTGASAAYHLGPAVHDHHLHVAIIDRADPATEASGRNGGNFELIPENSVGLYTGLARERLRYLLRVYPSVPIEVLRAESERQASVVLGMALRNRDRLQQIIRDESIDCDFSPRGWLYLAHTESEEQGICEEVMLGAQHGQRIELWPRRKIFQEFDIRTDFVGRFVPGDGTYHPFKYVCGVISAALKSGVELYTRVRVKRVRSMSSDRHDVTTDRGHIVARRVIVATNAFTRELLPEMRSISPRQSQIMLTEHALDRARGRTITTEQGPAFFNQPRAEARYGRAPLLFGGGNDRPMRNPVSRRRSLAVHNLLLRLRDRYYPELRGQPPTSEWVGPMAFTPDGLPAVGFVRPGVILAAGFNGYGGSYTTAAGQASAEMAFTDQSPDWTPQDVFSPRRFLSKQPLFLSSKDNLWRIAQALCKRLVVVNEQISFECTYGASSVPGKTPEISSMTLERMISQPGSTIKPHALRDFSRFADFSDRELRQLLRLMLRWDVPQGTLVVSEGGPGDSCFLIASGSVDVTVRVRSRQQLLAQLPAGSIFGQVSLISGQARTATCSMRNDGVILELERKPCETFLSAGSPTALKFLAALNQDLITALRGADQRLLQLCGWGQTPTYNVT